MNQRARRLKRGGAFAQGTPANVVKRMRVIGTAALLLIVGANAVGYAQDKNKGEKQNGRQKQAEPQRNNGRQQQGNRPVQQQRSQQQQVQQRSAPQQRAPQRQQVRVQQQRTRQQEQAQQGEQRGVWQQRGARNWESEHRTWKQRGGYKGYRISDDYFRTYYGRDHYFRVYSLPFVQVGGNPRFQYGGYWFTPVDPYPEYWGPTWYQTDDVYVDYSGDGYYLYDRRYPGRAGIAINISF